MDKKSPKKIFFKKVAAEQLLPGQGVRPDHIAHAFSLERTSSYQYLSLCMYRMTGKGRHDFSAEAEFTKINFDESV